MFLKKAPFYLKLGRKNRRTGSFDIDQEKKYLYGYYLFISLLSHLSSARLDDPRPYPVIQFDLLVIPPPFSQKRSHNLLTTQLIFITFQRQVGYLQNPSKHRNMREIYQFPNYENITS